VSPGLDRAGGGPRRARRPGVAADARVPRPDLRFPLAAPAPACQNRTAGTGTVPDTEMRADPKGCRRAWYVAEGWSGCRVRLRQGPQPG